MVFKTDHIHLKTPDPDATVKWYVDNLNAKVVASGLPYGGYRIDLHGLPIAISKFFDHQTHKQVYGFEHIAIDTDDLPGAVAKLKASGAKILEESSVAKARKVCFFEGPQGVIVEVREMLKAAD